MIPVSTYSLNLNISDMTLLLAEGVMSEDDTQQAGVFNKKISQICRSIPRRDLCIGQFW